MKFDSKQLNDLLKAFESAEERVITVILNTEADSVEEFKLKVDKTIDRIMVELTHDSIAWAKKDLPTAYKEGERRIDGHITYGATVSENSIEDSYIQLSRGVKYASDNAKSVIEKAIQTAESSGGYGATVSGVKQAIQDALAEENASMTITYSNGAKMPLSAYAQMLARTSRIETSNTGSFDRCKELNIDLVRCTTMLNCCPYCKRYEGKIYSISGKDTRFPALYETALQRGYNIMHPNCRHEFIPFVEEMYTQEELQNLQKESNHFPEYKLSDKIFRVYNKNQALQRQWLEESREFDRFKATLGDEMPYTTLGGFRQARRANSSSYQQLHKEVNRKTKK